MTTKLILDPGLFEVASDMPRSDQIIHYLYLQKSIDFVDNHLVATLDQYDGAPYYGIFNDSDDCCRPPITQSLTVKNNFPTIRKGLQRMIRAGEYVDVSTISDEIICPVEFESDTMTEIPFKRYLQVSLTKENVDSNTIPLLLLSMRNISYSPSLEIVINEERITLLSVGNPATDCRGVIVKFLFKTVDSHSKFPQSAACTDLNEDFLEKKQSACAGVDDRGLYIKYGNETASRNGYIKKDDLDRKNPGYHVFEHPLREYYLSIDLEHGGLEIFRWQKKNPPHLGEYDFSCNFIKGPNTQTHKLNV